MGCYADLKVGNTYIYSFKNYVDKDLVARLFSDSDLKVNKNGEKTTYVYYSTVRKIKERLDVFEYTLESIERIFNEKKSEILKYTGFFFDLNSFDYKKIEMDEFENKLRFNDIKNTLKKIMQFEMKEGKLADWNINYNKFQCETICDKIFYDSIMSGDSFYGFDIESIRPEYIIRLLLDMCPNDEKVIFDITELQDYSENSLDSALNLDENYQKIIVLVEGTSDKDVLEFAFKYLYPHLYNLFYFMDFEMNNNLKRDGGSSFVEKNMKIFAFSKIQAKFIAIFDNDAEGMKDFYRLSEDLSPLPNNIRILRYPDLALCDSYPTLYPNGNIVLDNINGKACSIELYLPRSIISNSNGVLYPIEWESRKEIIINKKKKYTYQGVISNKDLIKKEFHKIKKQIESGKKIFEIKEWENLDILLRTIIFAFN